MDVSAILENAKSELKKTTVEKVVPLEFDLGYLYCFDSAPIDQKNIQGNLEENLLKINRDNSQLLINEIFSLSTKQINEAVIATLPFPKTSLPREKSLPKEKGETRWEKFAKEKGIQKRKRSRMIFDEASEEYKPRYGYKRANDDTKDWLIEVPEKQDVDPMEDQFAKRIKEKKERILKNQNNQKKNIQREQKSQAGKKHEQKLLSFHKERSQLKQSVREARLSTASIGKFDKQLPNEPEFKIPHMRKKFDPATVSSKDEKEKVDKALGKVLRDKKKKEGDINVTKAARMAKTQQDKKNYLAKRSSSSSSARISKSKQKTKSSNQSKGKPKGKPRK